MFHSRKTTSRPASAFLEESRNTLWGQIWSNRRIGSTHYDILPSASRAIKNWSGLVLPILNVIGLKQLRFSWPCSVDLKKKKNDNNHSVYSTSPVSQKAAWVSLLQRAEVESESVNTRLGGASEVPCVPSCSLARGQLNSRTTVRCIWKHCLLGSAMEQVKHCNPRLYRLANLPDSFSICEQARKRNSADK